MFKSNRTKIVVAIVSVLVFCCVALFAYGAYYNSTPEGQVAATVRAEEKEATRDENTAVAAAAATKKAMPTDTAVPTNTIPPTLTPHPTNTLSPEAHLQAVVENALSSSNRDVARVADAKILLDTINIEWSINDNLTEDMIRSGAQLDAVDILEAIDSSTLEYNTINLIGTFPLVDVYGNSEETQVVWITYSFEAVDKINWSNFLYSNIYIIADSVNLHPVFQE